MLTIKEYRTNKVLAEVTKREFSKVCNANVWLPHHKAGAVWFVIL